MNLTARNTTIAAAAYVAIAAASGYIFLHLRLRQWQTAATVLMVERLTADTGPTLVSCGTCEHSRMSLSEDGEGQMQCHQGPPAMTMADDGARVGFPLVRASDYCAQWQPTDNNQEWGYDA